MKSIIMSNKTALLISAGKYFRIADVLEMNIGEKINISGVTCTIKDFTFIIGSEGCLLCQMYSRYCEGCPVDDAVEGCEFTPYQGFSTEIDESCTITQKMVFYAREEALFLQGLAREI